MGFYVTVVKNQLTRKNITFWLLKTLPNAWWPALQSNVFVFDADDDGRDGGDNGDDDGRHLEGADQVFAVSASVMEHLVQPRGCLLIALLMAMVMLVMMMVVVNIKMIIIQGFPEKVFLHFSKGSHKKTDILRSGWS